MKANSGQRASIWGNFLPTFISFVKLIFPVICRTWLFYLKMDFSSADAEGSFQAFSDTA